MIALTLFGALVLLSRIVDQPEFIDRIVLENPTVYDLNVEVSDGRGEGWMALATADHTDTTVVYEVYDIGDVWLFRFSGQGVDGGDLRLRRATLVRDRWRVQIPARVEQQLRGAGAPLPPP